MEILVMGGTEFVSAALARHLVERGYTVDILTRGVKSVGYTGIRNRLRADRHVPDDVRSAIGTREYDVVFDISAYTRRDVELLIPALKRSRLRSYIFCSSGAVYIPSNEFINEDYPRGPNPHWGEYGLDKKEAEDYLLELHRGQGFPAVIFRPTYIYGEGNNLYRETYLFDRITKGLPIPIPGGEEVHNQFLYIGDLVRTFERAMFCDQATGRAWNLTHPEALSWRMVIGRVMEVVGREVEVVEISPETMRERGLEPRDFFPFRNVNYTLDTARLRGTSLPVPETDLKEGLAATYAWYCHARPHLHDPRMTKVEFLLQKG